MSVRDTASIWGHTMITQTGTRWGVILTIWAAGLGAAAQYGKISVTFERLPELYPAVGGAASFAVSLVGVLGILFGVVAGMFVAGFGFRRTFTWSMWLGAAMSALQALHLPFGLFLFTRVVEGISHLGVVVAGPTLIALLAAQQQRGLAMTLWSSFFGVAFALLAWIGVPFADAYGVLALYGAHAVFMAVLAVALARALKTVRVPPRKPFPALNALPALHLKIYRSPWKMGASAGWIFYTCCFVSLLTLLPPYIAPQWRAQVMGAMPLASIASSLTLGVFLLRHLAAVRVVQLGFVLSTGLCVWLWMVPGDPVGCLALAAALGLVQGASFAVTPQLNPDPTAQAEANGALAQAGNMGNTVGTPMMAYVLAQGGFGAMITLTGVLLVGGALAHAALALQRRRATAQ